MKLLFSIFILSLSTSSVSASFLRKSPRTAALSSSSPISSTTTPTTLTSLNPISISISTATIPTPTTPSINNEKKNENEAEAFLTAAKATVTPAPEIIIDGAGRVLTLMHGSGEDGLEGGKNEGNVKGGMELGLQEKWHLTTFTSCHTFDATFTYCGVHEPVLPGGDEIAAAVRPLGARGGLGRAIFLVLGTLVGVDVFLR